MATTQIIFLSRIFNFDEFIIKSTSIFMLAMLFHFANSIIFYFYLILFLKILILIICISNTILLMAFIKLRQTYRYLSESADHFMWSNFFKFKQNHLETCQFFSPTTRLYGKIFTTFLFVNAPANVWLTMRVIYGQAEPGLAHFFVVQVIIIQIVVIFGTHLFIVQYSRFVHLPCRLLIHLFVAKLYKIGDLKSRMRMSATIQVLHTKNRYGITYGAIALVTINTFAKVSSGLCQKIVMF